MGLVARFLGWLAPRLFGAPRVIYDRAGGSPYLSRWHITAGPKMPDGSSPWTPTGGPREGQIWPQRRFAILLHRFHRGDDDLELHNHPWTWAVSLILAGGYREERRAEAGRIVVRDVKPGRLNVIRSSDFHRVDLLEDEAWSLFITGPKFSSWGFWNRDTKSFLPWREFIARKRGEVVDS